LPAIDKKVFIFPLAQTPVPIFQHMKRFLYLFGIVILLTFSASSFAQSTATNQSVPGAGGYPPANDSNQRSNGNLSPLDGTGTLGNSFSMTRCGLNFVSISNKLGQRFSPQGIPQPAPYVVSGLSPCDSIIKAFLYVEGSGTGAAQTVTIQPPIGGPQNFPMTLIGTGPDKCWGYASSVSYRADVTSVIGTNGTYNLSNVFTNPPNAGEDMDGATLIIIYADRSATYQGTINIDDGAMICTAFNSLIYNMNFTAPCGPTTNEQAFCCIGDLQNPTTTISMNGTPTPYVYDWWNYLQMPTTVTAAQTTANFSALAGGDCYNLCVVGMYWQTTSCATCGSSQSSTLAVNATSTVSHCSACDGTATATPTPAGSYTYSWNPSGQTTQTATNLCPGVYTVTVTGACVSATTTVTVNNAPSPVTSTQSAANVTCFGGNNGTGTVTPAGGLSPYTYSWSPTGGNNATATGLSAGSYTVTITDANGCQTTATIVITQPPQLTSTGASTNITCNGGTNGTGSITAAGGTPSYTYSWSPSGGTNATATGLGAGNYTVTATDANGCITTQAVTITQPSPVSVTAISDSICSGSPTQISANGSGGVSPYSYVWSNGPTTQTNTVNITTTTTFTVVVTDANGCPATTTATVTVNPVPVATISSNAVNGIYTLNPNNQLCFYGPSSGVTAWNWTLQPGTSNLPSPCVTITAADTGTYCAQLIVQNIHGCADTANLCLEISNVFYSIPNVFTPNGDGTNEAFIITNTGMKSLHCIIYDRWGVLIYEWDDPNGYWDGKTKSGNEAVDGVYYWTVDMMDYSGKEYGDHGFVHLIRGKK
jgi:gliding motility-associated-like protein